MTRALRATQIIVLILILPMIALGGMSIFSEGGGTPAYQEISVQIVMMSIYIPVPSIILAEIIYRLMKHTRLPEIFVIPVFIAAIPLVMWVGLIVWLQQETGFFG